MPDVLKVRFEAHEHAPTRRRHKAPTKTLMGIMHAVVLSIAMDIAQLAFRTVSCGPSDMKHAPCKSRELATITDRKGKIPLFLSPCTILARFSLDIDHLRVLVNAIA